VTTHNAPAYEAYLLKLKQVLMCVRRPCEPARIVSLVSEFVFEVPVSWTLAKKAAAWGQACRAQNAGDSDNLQKPVADALQEMGWIENDAHVGAMLGVKRYQKSPEETPKTILTLLALSA
jgi:Holliday junction resolvase RusA-like endonuclease